MWKLIPKVTLVVVALLSCFVYANGNDEFEQDEGRRALRLPRGGMRSDSTNHVRNLIGEDDYDDGGYQDYDIKKEDDRELILTEDELQKLIQDVSRNFRDMTEDERELFFQDLIGDMAEDERELLFPHLSGQEVDMTEDEVKKLSQYVGDLSEDDRELFFGPLLGGLVRGVSRAIPALLRGGSRTIGRAASNAARSAARSATRAASKVARSATKQIRNAAKRTFRSRTRDRGSFQGNDEEDYEDNSAVLPPDAPPGAVLCAGTDPGEYCDCTGDCTNQPSFCYCEEAQECCGH